MNHATAILVELNRHLTNPVELTLYGRAAFSLGFRDDPSGFGLSMDVDAVLPLGAAEHLLETSNFWQAIAKTNEALAEQGLYVSHLFGEEQVILRSDWMNYRVAIPGEWPHITLYRLGDEDLFLSKLMRDDPHDHGDALFLVRHNQWSREDVTSLIESARIPPLTEIEIEYAKATSRILDVLR